MRRFILPLLLLCAVPTPAATPLLVGLEPTGVAAGTYSNGIGGIRLTIDAKGRITGAVNGIAYDYSESINGGFPNGTGALIHWSQLLGVPAGFADGVDDDTGASPSPGIGTVTSVGLSLPALFFVTGSPVTTNGTISATLNSQLANSVLAGPTNGAAAEPTFRALVSEDLPVIDDDNVAFDDADGVWTATTIGAALEELNDSINSGLPNGAGAKVHWSQLLGVPAGFADGTDDGTGGGSLLVNGGTGGTNLVDTADLLWTATGGSISGSLSGLKAAQLWQATNAALTRVSGIGVGTSGDTIYRDATGWTNLAKGADGTIYTLSGGFPTWTSNVTALVVSDLVVSNAFPASYVSNSTPNRFIISGPTGLLTNDIAETGTGAPVRAASPAFTGTLTVNGTNAMAAIDGKQPLDPDLTTLGTLNASALTNLNATELRSGTVPTNRLDANTVQLAVAGSTGTGTFMRTRTGVARTLIFPAGAFMAENTAGDVLPATPFTNLWATTTDASRMLGWRFSATSTNGILSTFSWPQTWGVSSLNVRIYWKQLVAESGVTNVWAASCGAAGDGETMGNMLGTAVTILDQGQNDTNKLAITSWSGNITAGNTPAAGELATLSIRRLPGDTSDNMSQESVLLNVVLEFTESSAEPFNN